MNIYVIAVVEGCSFTTTVTHPSGLMTCGRGLSSSAQGLISSLARLIQEHLKMFEVINGHR